MEVLIQIARPISFRSLCLISSRLLSLSSMIALEILVPICVCSIGTWHPIQTYICPPRTPSFVLLHVCLPPFGFFDSLSLSMLSFQLFLCLSASLFPLSFHVHAWSMDTWSKGATSQAQAKRARMQARRCKPTKGNVQQIRRPSLLEWLHLSLSIIASSLEQCICDANLNRHALRPNKQYQNMMRTSIDTL